MRTLDTMLRLISETTTSTGLTVKASLIDRVYQKGIKVSQEVWDALFLKRRSICPQWNYMIFPRTALALDLL